MSEIYEVENHYTYDRSHILLVHPLRNIPTI